MAYGYQNSQDSRRYPQKETVNTTGIIFRNPEQWRYMNLTYWDSFLGIEIGSLSQESLTDFRNAPPPDVRQVIGFSDISSLLSVCEEVYDSLKERGTFTPVGVRVSAKKAHIIEISNGSNIGLPEGLYLVIYKNVDPTGRTAKKDVYPFQGREVIRGYDHLSGKCTEDISRIQEFKEFMSILKEAMKAFTNAQAHAIKKAQHSETMSGLKLLAAITGKCGVDPLDAGVKVGTTKNGSFYINSIGPQQTDTPQFNTPMNSAPQQPTFVMGNRNTPFETPVDMNVDLNLDASRLQEVDNLPF